MADIEMHGKLPVLKRGEAFVSLEELKWLRSKVDSLPAGAVIVEIGSWKGRSAIAMFTTDRLLVCVDPFTGNQHDITGELAKRENILYEFLSNISLANVYPAIMRTTSEKASHLFAKKSVDMIWIDGDHDLLFEDISYWEPALKEGALVCGHDGSWPVIQRAIDRYKEMHPEKTISFVSGTNIWYFIK